MSQVDDAAFIRNFSLVLVFLTVVGIIAFILAKIVYADFLETQGDSETVAARLEPIGSVNIGEPFVVGQEGAGGGATMAAADSAAPADPGAAAYGKICYACHDAGIGGAPKMGDKDAWADRLQKGTEMLVSNAISGIQGEAGIMPARGGLASLSDEEVRAAVMHMLASVGEAREGASTSAPDAAATTAAAPAEAAPEVSAEPEAAGEPMAAANGRGKEVYDSACFICHATGVAGAPKIGDTAGWEPRIAQGTETLYTHAIKGFMGEAGLMPPKGGRMDYSDDDVRAAVELHGGRKPVAQSGRYAAAVPAIAGDDGICRTRLLPRPAPVRPVRILRDPVPRLEPGAERLVALAHRSERRVLRRFLIECLVRARVKRAQNVMRKFRHLDVA